MSFQFCGCDELAIFILGKMLKQLLRVCDCPQSSGYMQAATAASPPGAGGEAPQEGDGFTYEHLAAKDQLWLDFAADTGDGG